MPTFQVGIARVLATCQIRSPNKAFKNVFPWLSLLADCFRGCSGSKQLTLTKTGTSV
jgi:hypothetical protein